MPIRILIFIVIILAAIFVYVDATKRGVRATYAIYMGLFTLIFPWFVLPIYLLLRHRLTGASSSPPDSDKTTLCSKCGKDNPSGETTCKHCGNKLNL